MKTKTVEINGKTICFYENRYSGCLNFVVAFLIQDLLFCFFEHGIWIVEDLSANNELNMEKCLIFNDLEVKKIANSSLNKPVFEGNLQFCSDCGCILEFRYTEYIPSLNCSLLGKCCINKRCAKFGKVFEPSSSEALKLSRLGFALRKFGGKKN